MRKAVGELSGNKAPGPDTIPGDLFKKLPATVDILQRLINAMVETGNVPKALRMVHLVLLDKPGKNERARSSKRPISLINTTIKIAEAAVYNRIIHQAELSFHPDHYAYRRMRGTDTHLTGLTHTMLAHFHFPLGPQNLLPSRSAPCS